MFAVVVYELQTEYVEQSHTHTHKLQGENRSLSSSKHFTIFMTTCGKSPPTVVAIE